MSDAFPFVDPKTEALAAILSANATSQLRNVLVVGCGKGIEAAVLCDSLKAQAVGIDINPKFDPEAGRFVDLRYGDATRLEFQDESFDAVYSFHALEHIPEYRKALVEIKRVLRNRGVWLIGTPNRDRMIGYLGSPGVSFARKLKWNAADWKARVAGRFRNELGAHAGFTAQELRRELSDVFTDVNDVTLSYYLAAYSERESMVRAFVHLGVARWLFPAVYFVGTR